MQGTGRRRLYLMRHGHVDYFNNNITDPRSVPLTQEGRNQAQSAANSLSDCQYDFAACSGLPRTVETAEIILRGNKRPPDLVSFSGLEELKSGWIKAESREELAARLAFCFDNAEKEGARFLPDGETFREARTRIVTAMEDIVFNHSWKAALIVAHEGVNRILLDWFCGGDLSTVASFEQDLCCINVIDLDITPADDGEGLMIERSLLKAVNLTPYDTVKAMLPKTSLEHLFDVEFDGLRPKRSAQSHG